MQSAIEDAEKSIFGMRQGIERKRQVHLILSGIRLYANWLFLQLSILNSYLKIRKGVPYESHYKFLVGEFYETLPIRWESSIS